MQRFARAWREANRGTTDVERLVGFCLAVKASAFAEVGGFDERFEVGGYEDDDLCQRLRDAGGRLVIAHASFVHHVGHQTFDANDVDWFALQERNRTVLAAKHADEAATGGVLVSACLIVRDESASIRACLYALKDVVDEVVVYDTGSIDGTPELAEAVGATVIRGHWDDDFAPARNAALERVHRHLDPLDRRRRARRLRRPGRGAQPPHPVDRLRRLQDHHRQRRRRRLGHPDHVRRPAGLPPGAGALGRPGARAAGPDRRHSRWSGGTGWRSPSTTTATSTP